MLDNEKVDQFYSFLKSEYYNWWKPEKIVLISPNHFHTDTKEIQTICESADVNYKSTTESLSSKLHNLWVKCDENWEIFDTWWDIQKTNEHGIGEHFQWINKYFPNSEVLPIISPCFQLSAVENVLTSLKGLNWNILVIASVDFAHYQNEQQTLQHDQKSIETLKSMTLNQSEFIGWIDADCPVCLYLLQTLANQNWKKAELRYRDSSSTILWKDMKEENTSRLFIWYK
jgi:AmmeMemoRadiSam system protein B